MNILIATYNQDKFRIVKALLSKCGLSDCSFKKLYDVGIMSQAEESGDLVNRAMTKARNAHNLLADKNEQFDVYVGIDDGMKYRDGDTDENSKEITEKILSCEFLDIGEKIINARAFVFLDSNGNIIDQFEAEIPFRFMGNPKGIKLQEASYPLRHVLAPLNGEDPMAEMKDEDAMDYYMLFLGEGLREATKKAMNKL